MWKKNGSRQLAVLAGVAMLFTGCGASGTQDATDVPQNAGSGTGIEAGIGTESGSGSGIEETQDAQTAETSDGSWLTGDEALWGTQDQKLTETDLTVLRSIVQVQAGTLYGSGVVYDMDADSVWIATAGHVLDDNYGEVFVTFPEGTQVQAQVAAQAADADLAFLQVGTEGLPAEAWKSFLPVSTDRDVFDGLAVYDDVWMYGSDGKPVYGFIVEPWIYVEDFGQDMMLLQGQMEPGMSGGGVFTADGVFVGILCGADESGKVAVVPYSVVETEKP